MTFPGLAQMRKCSQHCSEQQVRRNLHFKADTASRWRLGQASGGSFVSPETKQLLDTVYGRLDFRLSLMCRSRRDKKGLASGIELYGAKLNPKRKSTSWNEMRLTRACGTGAGYGPKKDRTVLEPVWDVLAPTETPFRQIPKGIRDKSLSCATC